MVGGPEFPEMVSQRRGHQPSDACSKRWHRPPWAPVVSPADYVRGMARRVECQIVADWHLLPLLWNLYLRHRALTTPLPLFQYAVKPGTPQDTHAADLLAAVEKLYARLEQGTYTVSGQTRKLDGDVAKLSYADSLTDTERHLLRM